MGQSELVLPRYGDRSLADVLPAALRALGVRAPGHVDGELELDPSRAIVVLLIDGLGAELLIEHGPHAPFLLSLPDAGPLTAGFPSSTPVGLASLGTGLPPGAHGLLGVSFRAPGGALLDSLKWTSHGLPITLDLLETVPPEEVQDRPTAFERAEADGIGVTVVSNREFRGSGLTRAALRGGRFRGVFAVGDLVAEIVAAVARPGRQLCYGYFRDLDTIGHLYGPGGQPWRMQLTHIDRLATMVAENVPSDTTVLITGDHGMVGVSTKFDADTDPDLQQGVALLGGDPRSRHVYARPGAYEDVLAAWRAKLGQHAWVCTGNQAVADGWFGAVSPTLRDRVGDVVVAMRDASAVIRSVAEPDISRVPGQHGSLTSAEQLVPLLVAGPA